MNIKSIIKPNQLLNPYFTAIVLAILIICLLPKTTHAATNTINILIKGEPVQFSNQTGRPFIDSNSRTLVPMRIVMEKYGCTVDWEQESLSAIVKKGDVTVKVPTMQKFIMVNNVIQNTDTQPQNINGRIYLPVAAVLRAVGADMQWDNKSRSVVIDGNANNSVGMVKPEGYDEFMKDFEVVGVHDLTPISDETLIMVQNKKLNTEELEDFLLSKNEITLKNYINYFLFNNMTLIKNNSFKIGLFSNKMTPSTNDTFGFENSYQSCVLIVNGYRDKMNYNQYSIYLDFRDWRIFLKNK